jgi:MoaA/NifB/PqqE/SkfB family radical SAM enzyme
MATFHQLVAQKVRGEYATPRKAMNLALNLLEFRLRRKRLHSWPSKLTIDITNRCMLKCPLCPTGQGKTVPKGDMTPDQLARIMQETGPYVYSVDLFNWGEPLLHSDFFTMVKIVHDAGAACYVSTNLSFPPSENIDRLATEGPDRLVVSIDGITQDVYEKYRVGGHLEWAIDNIKRIQALKKRYNRSKPVIHITCHITKFNEHQIPALRQLAKDLNVSIGLNPLCVNAQNDAMFEKWLPTDPQWSFYDYETRQHKLRRRGHCDWLWRTMVINWDGTVNPCCYWFDEPNVFGNAIEEPIRSIWNNEVYVAARRALSGGSPSDTAKNCAWCQGVPPDTQEATVAENETNEQ